MTPIRSAEYAAKDKIETVLKNAFEQQEKQERISTAKILAVVTVLASCISAATASIVTYFFLIH